jgi:hypothetical protein
MMAMGCCIVPEENDVMFQQFRLFTMQGRSHLIYHCHVIYTFKKCMKWHRMVKHKPLMCEEYDVHHFQSILTELCNLLLWQGRGATTQHLVVSVPRQMNASMTNPSKCDYCISAPFANVGNVCWTATHADHHLA